MIFKTRFGIEEVLKSVGWLALGGAVVLVLLAFALGRLTA